MLAGQIVGMIGKAFTSNTEGQEKPKETPEPRKRKRGHTERFLKGQGFEIG